MHLHMHRGGGGGRGKVSALAREKRGVRRAAFPPFPRPCFASLLASLHDCNDPGESVRNYVSR